MLSSDDDQALIKSQAKNNELNNVTFLQICKNKGLVVFKTQVRQSAVRKLLGVTDVTSVSSPKNFRDSMGEVISFTYGKLLNVYEKKLANKAINYVDAVQKFAKKALIPEEDPEFDTVYNIIASADMVEAGILKVLEDLPHCRSLISCAVRRYKLKQDQILHLTNMEKSKSIVWKPWQQALLQELDASPDPRKIIWYYDPVGNSGKTFFAKWQNELSPSTAVLQNGKAKDLYHILAKHTAEIRTVIMDKTRASENGINYSVIESIKNGYFQSNKYDSRFISIPIPHLVVFANFQPKYPCLSVDRWDIRRLSESPPGRHWLPTEISNVYKTSMCLSHKIFFCRPCCKE
jgi:hypothetical protein